MILQGIPPTFGYAYSRQSGVLEAGSQQFSGFGKDLLDRGNPVCALLVEAAWPSVDGPGPVSGFTEGGGHHVDGEPWFASARRVGPLGDDPVDPMTQHLGRCPAVLLCSGHVKSHTLHPLLSRRPTRGSCPAA